jgi:hypothetical protein
MVGSSCAHPWPSSTSHTKRECPAVRWRSAPVNNRVVLDDTRAQSEDIIIPTWAVLGVFDYWVDKLSAGLQLSDARKRTVRGSHTAIVKPQSKQSDAYQYVHDRIREAYFQRRSAGLSQPSLPWSSLTDAFEDGKPHYFKLLRWNYRFVETLYGREHDLDEIVKWAERAPTTPNACLITGEGGAGKTRLVEQGILTRRSGKIRGRSGKRAGVSANLLRSGLHRCEGADGGKPDPAKRRLSPRVRCRRLRTRRDQ